MDEVDYRPDVVAGKYDASKFDPTGNHLLINEIFYSLQGEGGNAGVAQTFVRMSQCNLACKFCDTEFGYGVLRPTEEVAQEVLRNPGLWVDLTGGEPALQNLAPLIKLLQAGGKLVQMETSGSVLPPWLHLLDKVTVSPKVAKHRIAIPLDKIDEVKWVVNGAFLAQFSRDPAQVYIGEAGTNYLQPESNDPKMLAAAIKLIQANPLKYRLSVQLHKIIHVA